ncbi:MAG: hypothetical protein CFE21_05435 [Bacteroidetes bacterium B1(2017)]|nr:MAG: hypothetical protein CFE21_05435 [Bacteroidetes bacterium B1(2017)]
MAMHIFFEANQYSIQEFVALKSEQTFVMHAQSFLKNWISNLPFTFNSSGSTGTPKTLTFAKESLLESAFATIQALNLSNNPQHILLCLSAQFVGGAMMLARALALDCPITILEPSSNVFSKIGSEHPYTFASFVPMQIMSEDFNLESFKKIEVVLIGGTSVSKALEVQLSAYPNRVYHTYGMSETLSHVALKRFGLMQGYKAIQPYSINLNQDGCILITNTNSQQIISTHDIGEWVGEKEFIITGRTDFIINSGGLKINPEPIEKIVWEFFGSDLHEVFVLAKAKHTLLGEEAILVGTRSIDEKELFLLKEYLSARGFKKEAPKRYSRINQIPLTLNGKLNRLKVNEWLDSQLFLGNL